MGLNTFAPYSLPPTFCFTPVDVITEIKTVSTVINRCYNMHISPETVKTWVNHPVFDGDLWIWIYDKTRDKRDGIPYIKVGKYLRFNMPDVQNWLKENRD